MTTCGKANQSDTSHSLNPSRRSQTPMAAAAMFRSLSSSSGRRILLLSRSISTITHHKAFFAPTSPLLSSSPAIPRITDCKFSSALNFRRSFSADISHLPTITDPDIESAFKDLMATSWDEIPESVVHSTKKALSKATDDKLGQEALANVFRAAVASVEFGGVLVSLRMALDDLSGLTGENVGRLPEDLEGAMKSAYNRYMTYLNSFGPNEDYLRKKVETELGTKMIHLKMRCCSIGSEWGKVSLLGTSGLAGSYVEHRA